METASRKCIYVYKSRAFVVIIGISSRLTHIDYLLTLTSSALYAALSKTFAPNFQT